MHPFLDTSKLSDDEILEKIGKSYTILAQQQALGHTPTVQSIKEVIDALIEEKNKRMQKIIADDAAKKPASNTIDLGKLG